MAAETTTTTTTTTTQPAFTAAGPDKYSCVGPMYEALGNMWSMNTIPKCKNGALCAPYVFPGARVLIVGAGHGTDAIYCAKTFPEAQVTALDLSPTMLAQLDGRRRKAIPEATNLKLVQGSVFEYEDPEGKGYDLVLLNFFLNVFDRKSANAILDRVHERLLKIGGKVAVGDWSRPNGHALKRAFMHYHWYCCDILFHVIGSGQHVHPIWDMPQWYAARGIQVVERKFFRQLGCNMYECTIGEKVAAKTAEDATTTTTAQ